VDHGSTGVLLGSALWWLLLSRVGRFREPLRCTLAAARQLASAAVLAAFALWQFTALMQP
jgi:hypothetical protein